MRRPTNNQHIKPQATTTTNLKISISALGLRIPPPNRRVDNERERNGSKPREILVPTFQDLRPGISASFIFLGLILARWIGRTHGKCGYLGSARSALQPYSQPSRDKSHRKPRRSEGPRHQKSPRFLVAPPAPKISEILEPLGSPQEPF